MVLVVIVLVITMVVPLLLVVVEGSMMLVVEGSMMVVTRSMVQVSVKRSKSDIFIGRFGFSGPRMATGVVVATLLGVPRSRALLASAMVSRIVVARVVGSTPRSTGLRCVGSPGSGI